MILIGIITRKSKSNEGHNTNIIYSDIVKSIRRNGGIPLGIILDSNYKELINICDGIIFQGGDNFEEYDLEALKYIYDINKPVLGICLGMQLMGVLFNGNMIDIENHKSKYSHNVYIKKDTKLYKIFNKEILTVNSRHKSVVENTSLKISTISSDGYIEAIEATDKLFFIGVQWHPENILDHNDIFKCLIDTCKN